MADEGDVLAAAAACCMYLLLWVTMVNESISGRVMIGFDCGLTYRVKNMAFWPQWRETSFLASVFVYWFPRAIWLTWHDRPLLIRVIFPPYSIINTHLELDIAYVSVAYQQNRPYYHMHNYWLSVNNNILGSDGDFNYYIEMIHYDNPWWS